MFLAETSRTIGPWVAAGLFLVLGAFVIIANWTCVWMYYRHGRRSSTVPFLGGGLAAVGVALLPVGEIRQWWWVALALDIGCWTGVMGLPLLMRELIWSRRAPAAPVDDPTNTSYMLRRVTTPADLAAARDLFAEYAASIAHLCCASFESQGLDTELATLPGKYAEPRGRIYVAIVNDAAVGCAALRPIDALPGDAGPVCELKRMYIRPGHRGLHLGRLLCERIIADAREIGYGTLKLDTDPRLEAANALYKSLGFGPTPKFNNDPDPKTIYMAMALR